MFSHLTTRLAAGPTLLALAVGVMSAYPGTVSAVGGRVETAAGCARQFDRAVRAYVETTERRDLAGFLALLHPDVTVVFAGDGEVLDGKAATTEFLRDFFADPSWAQSFSVAKRTVAGCRTGFVLFDSVFTQGDARVPLLIGVSFTYRHGRWLVVQNQDSDGRV
ncbi:nuclear transport factor 2 family protein [Micromonospora endolithica]|uniref:DUF4440 domain-containing protein n=1 Tax=Micromonospora endolithica TaxID=230091 RepID=A0A3A9YVV6_9ACTN|nr:nuclear transport factor 2 family protein [Micromonospora endolithica]RKN40183.1 DUF4440 domain-containing protein [Micromonospora endolithica]TWJ22484.1 SnoaL-like protein [Micromonospora endolithica]